MLANYAHLCAQIMPNTYNDFAIQLGTAVKPVEQVDTVKGTTFFSGVVTDAGRKQIFLKLLKIEDIAREALCATLARMLGLPIKQAYYVSVDPSYIEGRRVGNAHHIAFGLERDQYFPTFRIQNESLDKLVSSWGDATNCALFDEWVFNNDRLPNNLIFDSIGVYWLIDHDEAIPSFAKPHMPANSSLLHLISQSKSEFELWKIRDIALHFVDRLDKIDWDLTMELMRASDLPTSESYYKRYIDFLKERTPLLVDIVSSSIGIRQQQLQFSDPKILKFGQRDEE